MRKRWTALVLALGACGSSAGSGSADGPRRLDGPGTAPDARTTPDAGTPDAGTPDAPQVLRPVLPCADPAGSVYEQPAQGSEPLGTVLACAHLGPVSAADLTRSLQALAYSGRPPTSGTDVYRIAYRTDRGPGGRGVGTALVLVPDHPRASGPQPLVVAAHGTIGVAKRCAPSRSDLVSTQTFLDDVHSITNALSGDGWLVVVPDYGGYSTDSPPGFLLAQDAGQGVLDATRAAAALFAPNALSGKVALVGHSQGGHAVLSAQALAKAYGHYGELVAVAAYAPIWISAANMAAITADVSGLTLPGNPYLYGYAIQYMWTHAERYEGRAAAEQIFTERARAGVRAYVDNGCLLDEDTQVPALGTLPSDVFDAALSDDLLSCVLAPDTSCTSMASMTWRARFAADRPHLDPMGAPVMMLFGGADTTITPGRAQCAIDRVKADLAVAGATATLTVCGDPAGIHSGIASPTNHPNGVSRLMSGPVMAWLDERLLGGPAGAPCSPRFVPAGAPEPTCTTPPPND